MFTSDLMTQAVSLLRRHKGRFPQIAVDCGLSYSWVCKVSQGQLQDAAAGRLERLIKYLEDIEATDDTPQAAANS